jgi:hypothetical protein
LTLPALIAAMLEIAGSDCHRPCQARARVLAPVIMAEAGGLDPLLLAAISFKESSYRLDVVGRHGDLGPWQVRPLGMAAHLCRDLMATLVQPVSNLRCAIRILRYAAKRCGGGVEAMLSAYNGRRCGPSGYARRVLALMARHSITRCRLTRDEVNSR